MRNPAEGSEYACCHQHSTGRMCSACEDGYAMANGQCQECQRIHWLSVSFYIAVRGPGCCCQREGGGVCVRGYERKRTHQTSMTDSVNGQGRPFLCRSSHSLARLIAPRPR